MSYHYNKLKYRAKERGHQFTLSREKFAELWNGGLAQNHGKMKLSLSIDRVRSDEGYHDNNVRLLTLSENSRRAFVPFFKNQQEEAAAIAAAEAEVRAAYPELATP